MFSHLDCSQDKQHLCSAVLKGLSSYLCILSYCSLAVFHGSSHNIFQKAGWGTGKHYLVRSSDICWGFLVVPGHF